MKKIGITGSIASGKTTVSKIISRNRGPLFSADQVVKKLYKKNSFKKFVAKKLKIKHDLKFEKELKRKILLKIENLKKLEKIIHPLVRQEMRLFLKKNFNKKILFFEIPLLIEGGLSKFFDEILLVKSNKTIRLKRYISNGGNRKLFMLFNKKQLRDSKKIQFCDHVIVNNKSLAVLKKSLISIIKNYE